MRKRNPLSRHLLALLCVATLAPALTRAQTASPGQLLTALRATELRGDKLGSAPTLAPLAAGAAVKLLSSEGGWALVETAEGPAARGWVRASSLNWTAGASRVSGMSSGREAAGNTALTLGVRSIPARVNRHALIISISRYADAATPPLPGARIDKESATQMAHAMQVPDSNIRYLQDEQATGANIRAALNDLTRRVQDGDRVFIHFSGHGTRYNDPAAGGCVEALLAYDGGTSGTITNREMADLLQTITSRTDKLFVMYDACHSGGVAQAQTASTVRTRGFSNANDEGLLRPKFSNISEACGRPVNVKTRNLVVEATRTGTLPQDIIHLSASRDNEISFDDELKGGLATQFMRDCMLRDAKDLDNSGAITIEEIKQCAQEKIDRRMANDANFKPHHLVLNGNAAFVPAWFSQPAALLAQGPMAAPPVASPAVLTVPSAPVGAAPAAPAAQPAKPPATTPVRPPTAPSVRPQASSSAPAPAPALVAAPTPAPVPVSVPAPLSAPAPVSVPAPLSGPAPVSAPTPVAAALTGEQALRQLFDQRDAKRRVTVIPAKDKLVIGQDFFEFSVKSDRAGYLYVALAGSDNKALYLLFPNDLDANNRIEAGQTLQLPRPNWRARAAGPAGKDSLLVMVADAPRDLTGLGGSKAGPFVSSLNDSGGRARLGALMTTSQMVVSQACQNPATRRSNPLCSDAYGAAMLAIEEVQ